MKAPRGKRGENVLLFINATTGNQGQTKAAVDRSPCSTNEVPRLKLNFVMSAISIKSTVVVGNE